LKEEATKWPEGQQASSPINPALLSARMFTPLAKSSTFYKALFLINLVITPKDGMSEILSNLRMLPLAKKAPKFL
jgi:hypothetical protein